VGSSEHVGLSDGEPTGTRLAFLNGTSGEMIMEALSDADPLYRRALQPSICCSGGYSGFRVNGDFGLLSLLNEGTLKTGC
jgi:hypothetical protein